MKYSFYFSSNIIHPSSHYKMDAITIALKTLNELNSNNYMQISYRKQSRSIFICLCPKMISNSVIFDECRFDDEDNIEYREKCVFSTDYIKRLICELDIDLISVHTYGDSVVQYVYDISLTTPTQKNNIDWSHDKEAYLMMLCEESK